jgi:hypothetical protein
MSPAEAALRGRIGALTTHARHDSKTITSAARARFLRRFEDQVDPDRLLDETERQRRAHLALRAHMSLLALKSARARRRHDD